MPAFGDIKSGDSVFCISPPPPPPCKYQWPTPSPLINTNWPSLQHGCDLGGHYMKSCMKYTYRSSKFTLICDHIDEILIFVNDEVLAKMPQKPCYNYKWKKILKFWGKWAKFQNYTGLLIFREKKAKFRGIFSGKFTEKSAYFAGFSRAKSQNSRKNRPISQDFCQGKVKIHRKIGRFCQILAKKSQISRDFQRQILFHRKIGWFHGKFWGETSPRNNQ